MFDKQKNIEVKSRQKYVRTYNPEARAKRMGAQAKGRTLIERIRLKEAARKAFQEKLSRKKIAQNQKELWARTRQKTVEKAQQEAEKKKVMEKARERMRAHIRKLESKTATSAHQDNAFEKIRTGRTVAGMEELAKAGREGSFGNEMAGIDKGLVKESETITKNGGNGGSDLRSILEANSAPMLTINQGKYALSEEKEQKKKMEKTEDRPQTAFTKDEFLKEKMKERFYKTAG